MSSNYKDLSYNYMLKFKELGCDYYPEFSQIYFDDYIIRLVNGCEFLIRSAAIISPNYTIKQFSTTFDEAYTWTLIVK